MAKKPARAVATSAPPRTANDDIGEARRLEMYRLQVTIREAEQRKVGTRATSWKVGHVPNSTSAFLGGRPDAPGDLVRMRSA